MNHKQLTRFLTRFKVNRESGCWEWINVLSSNGYGQFSLDGKNYNAHCVSYRHFKGEYESNLELDHLCRNKVCVNPDHLEPVTHRENMLRGNGWAARNAAKTHCPSGHAYTAENIVPVKHGKRCRICRAARWKVDGKRRREKLKRLKT